MFDGFLPETNCDPEKSAPVARDGIRSPIARSVRGVYPVRWMRPVLPAKGPAIASGTMWSAAAPGDGAAGGSSLHIGCRL